MSKDIDITNEVILILCKYVPDDADTILMKCDLSKEGDVSSFSFAYSIDMETKELLIVDHNDFEKIDKLMLQLREFYVSNNQPPWNGCDLTVNFKTNKFLTEFDYERDMFELKP